MRTRRASAFIILLLGCLLVFPVGLQAAAPGSLRAVINDSAGNPIPHLLVSLIARSAEALPFLTRTDDKGHLHFQDIGPGTYEISVTSARYESPAGRLVQIEAGQTASLRLVLQEVLTLGAEPQNLGIKSLLRTAGRRMIFRSTPGAVEESPRTYDRAAFELYTNTGLGSDTFGYPGRPVAGTTTSFAFRDSLPVGADHIVAGQMNSGPDSSWRVKNFISYELGGHSLQVFLGYGRLSLNHSGNYRDPGRVALEEVGAPADSARILSAGFEDRMEFGDSLSLFFGMELNQVHNRGNQYFLNPSGGLEFSPLEGTRFRLLLASKRPTQANTVRLADGGLVNVADAVHIATWDDATPVGTARHLEALFSQALGEKTEVELAAFKNQLMGVGVPLLAYWEEAGSDVVSLSDREAGTRGYRVAVNRQITPHVSAKVSYVRTEAMGINAPEQAIADVSQIGSLFRRQTFHGLTTEVDAFIPASQTRVRALLKAVPSGGSPLTSLDAFADVLETGNQGLNLFVRQLVPVPTSLMGLIGLDFLSEYQLELLLDVRNLTNEEIAWLQSGEGSFVLLQQPRSVRGGIAVNF